jgi:Mrp family chromosome partitioning ATPase/LPS O-antigen subunit length determinant protein (WzzB/FepE family)
MSQVRPGILIAIIVFAIFAAYAYLAPTTYRTSALLMVESGVPSQPAKLPEPLEAARRLSEAILDRAMLERLAKERAASEAPEAKAAAASQVRQLLEIDTSDAHAFSISYRDTDRLRVQRACNDLARHAFEVAPQVLVDRSAERESELKRQQRTQELAAFLALHPEAAAEAPPTGQSLEKDPALSAFHAERANLEKRLLDLERGRVSDNPYLEPREFDPTLLRRRLAEINSALSARRDAFTAKAPSKGLSPELRSEWQRLLESVTKAAAEGQVAAPPLVARIASTAPTPSSPIDPNRSLLLFFGVVFGGGLGAAYTLVARAAQQRRTKSSRPPSSPVPPALNVELPPAPAVPSGLGPAVPVYQAPAASSGPPIVPIAQRPISSSPPAPFNRTQPLPLLQSPEAANAERKNQPSTNPPPAGPQPRRFASTLVLPPAENPVGSDAHADPVLASAARVWDEEIRAHAVPGFAVVRPGSEPPSARPASSAPPRPAAQMPAAHVPATPAPRSSRPRNQMKVTQPLGSFMPELLLKESAALRAETASRSSEPSRPPAAQHASAPSGPPAAQSRYSYVSSVPPAENTVTIVRPTPSNWAPDATLVPALRRPVCEQLYPLAVEGCFIVVVVGVPESLEQKSRVAAELALALAESGHPRILLMEGDLTGPRVHRLMNVSMPMSSGFSQQLRDRINGKAERRWTVVGCGKVLHVLAEGMMRSPGLLLSQQFSEGLADLRNYYDFIIIDGPSTSLPGESQALDAVANGVVYVCGKQGSAGLAKLQALFAEKRLQTVVTSP